MPREQDGTHPHEEEEAAATLRLSLEAETTRRDGLGVDAMSPRPPSTPRWLRLARWLSGLGPFPRRRL